MPDRTTRWTLYIDESGEFSGKPSVVTGVAFAELDTFAMRKLQVSVEDQLPEVVWPPHATLCKFPGLWLVWGARRASPLSDLARAFEHANPTNEAFARVMRALNRGREPEYDDVRELSNDLRSWSMDRYRYAERIARERRRRLTEMFRAFCQQHTAFGFIAGTSHPDDKSLAADGYLACLRVLVERVRDRLSLIDGEHAVTIFAASRPAVEDPKTGTLVRLGRPHLVWASEELSERRTKNTVRFSPGGTPSFRVGPAALVLADWASNTVYGDLGADLATLSSEVSSLFGLNLGGDYPNAAATGLPHAAVNTAAIGGRPVPINEVKPPWAIEQAKRWIDHFSEQT